jgi:F-type H+-transporting ATPase subunit epsilon
MLNINVISPTGTVYEGDVAHVTFPGEIGQFEVFPKHAALISTLVEGDILCFPADGEDGEEAKPTAVHIKSGFVEVKNDKLNVCVETE